MKMFTDTSEESSSQTPDTRPQSPLFSFRPYQRDDLARAACRNGAIIGWDPGLGKTMGIFALPFIKKSRYTLIVAPASLHEQIIDEGRNKFHVEVTPIPDQKTAISLISQGILPHSGIADPLAKNHSSPITAAAPRFFITSYNWLGYNGADEWAAPCKTTYLARISEMSRFLPATTDSQADQDRRATLIREWQLGIGHSKTYHVNQATEETPSSSHAPLSNSHTIKCVFTPTLASIIHSCFDCLVGDEAVRVKSGEAKQAEGILRMAPKSRYLFTGTPIKNRLPDFFFLAAWVTGFSDSPSAIWPYGNTLSARDEFAKDFGVMEENETRKQADRIKGVYRRHVRTTAKICNVHRLWRVISGVLIRRSKDMVEGSGIVRKTIIPVHVMPGTSQAATYRFHLQNPEKKASALATIGTQLQRLRIAALDPTSPSISRDGFPLSRSHYPWTPKLAGIIQLSIDLMKKGEQLVIFSPFQSFSDSLRAAFTDAAIPNLCLDGNTSPKKRGSLIKQFKNGNFPVLIAGINSMGEGHNLDNSSNLVLPSLSWADDENTQAIERVHRLTSKKDVTIYVMVTENSLDLRLLSLWQEKRDSSSLALDGRLPDRDNEEIDLGQLLHAAVTDFNPASPSLDEDEVKAQWETTLRPSIKNAYETYKSLRPIITESKIIPFTKPERTPTKTNITPQPPSEITPQPNRFIPVTLQFRRKQQGKPLAIPANFF